MSHTPKQAAEALRRGELILLPTETVYGLGADASDPDAVAAIFEAKGRPRFNPLIAHVADRGAAEEIGMSRRFTLRPSRQIERQSGNSS